MRFARKLMLLALAAVAVMALAASSASAQPEATVEGGAHCGDLEADGTHAYTNDCHLTATNVGDVELRALFGIMYLCDNDYEGNINENGEGFIYNQTLNVPGTTNPCGVQPCKESGGAADPWPAELTSETTMEATFCVTGAFGIIVNCHLAQINLTNITHDSAEAKTANHAAGTHTFCESDSTNAVLGHWDITSESPGVVID